jgi:hypothetical protein
MASRCHRYTEWAVGFRGARMMFAIPKLQKDDLTLDDYLDLLMT